MQLVMRRQIWRGLYLRGRPRVDVHRLVPPDHGVSDVGRGTEVVGGRAVDAGGDVASAGNDGRGMEESVHGVCNDDK